MQCCNYSAGLGTRKEGRRLDAGIYAKKLLNRQTKADFNKQKQGDFNRWAPYQVIGADLKKQTIKEIHQIWQLPYDDDDDGDNHILQYDDDDDDDGDHSLQYDGWRRLSK